MYNLAFSVRVIVSVGVGECSHSHVYLIVSATSHRKPMYVIVQSDLSKLVHFFGCQVVVITRNVYSTFSRIPWQLLRVVSIYKILSNVAVYAGILLGRIILTYLLVFRSFFSVDNGK